MEEGVRSDIAIDFGYGTSTEPLDLEATSYLIQLDVDDDDESDYEFSIGRLLPGADVLLLLFDDTGTEVYLMAAFADGQTIRFNPRT
jgi:hypothetical protein